MEGVEKIVEEEGRRKCGFEKHLSIDIDDNTGV